MDDNSAKSALGESVECANPRCPLFPTCGGCQYQNMAYGAQLKLKRRHIEELFKNFGDDLPPVMATIPSPNIYFYRTKLTPHYRRIRGTGTEPIGFLSSSGHELVDVPSCPIAVEEINAALPACRDRIRSSPTKRGGTALLRSSCDGVIEDPRKLAREIVCGKTFYFVAGEFFQNNSSALPGLIDCARTMAAADGIDYLVDAYCGVGFFSISLVEHFRKIAAVEICRESVRLGRLNGSIHGINSIDFFVGTAEDIFASVDFPPDKTAVLLDPPRSGCGRKFCDQLLKFRPRRVVYVSCGPESQVLDVQHLIDFYRIISIRPLDMFPQTKHIENIVLLELR
ncbi:MAG: SAM-dependent methyltransferase [Puniceicoccales bacterium]|jgi:23S rRNA (uracil1939-C5)-methyltransferase/tRNA (uracil-5-)-methyltransferase|nr:SAM-dependent methyltransferase [Puniceicoccales bacterium]